MSRRFAVRDMGKGILLNGTSQYFTFPNAAVPTTAFSVCFFYYHRGDLTANERLVDWQDAGPTDGFTITATAAGVVQFVVKNDSTTTVSINSPVTFERGKWYFIAATFEANSADFWVTKVGSQSLSRGTQDTSCSMSAAAALLEVGRRAAGANFIEAVLGEFMVFNEKLNQTQLEDLYFDHNIPESIVIKANFSDETATDFSGNENHGTLQGTPTFVTHTPFGARSSV